MSSSVQSVFEFMKIIGKLKRTVRTGWVLRGVKKPESVADHMYRMAALAFLATPDTKLNKDKCIKLCLVHDMAESLVGDLTPSCGVSKQEKHSRELAAMEHITGLLDSGTATEIFNLWEEYEEQTSDEARYVKDLDRFDMILQAFEYEQEDKIPGKLQEFFDTTTDKIKHPDVQQWSQHLCETREKTLMKNDDGS